MTQLRFKKIEGENKGKLCKDIIERAYNNFFNTRGIEKIKKNCNDRRKELIKEWKEKKPEEKMTEYGLNDLLYIDGILEICPDFELQAPKSIEVYIFDGKYNDKDAAMVTKPDSYISPGEENYDTFMENFKKDVELNKYFTWKLCVYLDMIKETNKKLIWISCQLRIKDLIKDFTIEEVAYHEFLHICGDHPLRCRKDGILRNNVIGIACINAMNVGLTR